MTALSEQAKGASEIAKAINDARKQSVQVAKAVTEQLKANQQSEQAARDVARLASSVSRATSEQGKAINSLVASGETVRRFARQTARAVGEQADVIASLTSAANRHTSALENLRREGAQQVESGAGLARAFENVRARGRAVKALLGEQNKASQAALKDEDDRPGGFDVSGPTVRMTEAEAERIGRIRQLGRRGAESASLLVDQLDDSSWVVRRAVVEVLAQLGDAPVAPLCDSLRRQRDNESRLAAIADALSTSTADVDDSVLELARDANPAVVADAAQILGRRRSKRATATLTQLAQAANDNVAVNAIEALGRIGGKAAVDSLIKAVRSGSFFRAFPAIDVLGRTGDPRAVAPLAELLNDPLYTQEAARALGRTGDPSALQPLITLLLRPSNALVRVAALAIVELLSTYESWYGRSQRSRPAGARRHAATESVRRVLGGASRSIPGRSKKRCARYSERSAAKKPFWSSPLDSMAPRAWRAAAAQALKKLGPAGEINLVAALRDGDSARRGLVLGVLAPRGVAVEDLIPCLRDPDGTVRARTCELLGKLGDRGAVAPLFELLGDPNARVAQAAVGALHALGGEVTERLALQAAQNGDRRRRREALRLIGYFGYSSALDVLKTRCAR